MADIANTLRKEAAILPHDMYPFLNPIMMAGADEIERLRGVLAKIAAYDDTFASVRLAKTGSYGSFDEPASVQAARRALEQKEDRT